VTEDYGMRVILAIPVVASGIFVASPRMRPPGLGLHLKDFLHISYLLPLTFSILHYWQLIKARAVEKKHY
jgi:hypothetical protein